MQHGTEFYEALKNLEEFTEVIELEKGDILYEDNHIDRGIFFIEEGVMKIQRQSEATLSRVGSGNTFDRFGMNAGSLNQLKARSGAVGRQLAEMKANKATSDARTLRVARLGRGHVIGSTELVAGTPNPGTTIAGTVPFNCSTIRNCPYSVRFV